jgi:DNA-binding Xre family transcriptional regulator
MLRFKLAERLADREFQERRRITVIELSEATGINRMTLSKLINHHGANVQSDMLDKLCFYFDCPIEDLVEYVARPPEQEGASV